ncbi:MAG: 30S ribosomal protein S8 [Planctomycetota bacterium]
MTMNDLVADTLTRIRNALRNREPVAEVIRSKQTEALVDVLKREGYVTDYQPLDTEPQAMVRVYLKYGPEDEDVINELQRISTPGRRVYRGVDDLGTVKSGLGIFVVSTSKGVLSDRECRQQRVGGEVLCSVW